MIDLSKYKAEWVKIADIGSENRMFQFRKDITPESVAELVKSLAAEGQKFPIVLWLRLTGERIVVAGLRRLTSAIILKWDGILAITIPESEAGYEEVLRLNFIENVERKRLNNLDLMLACKKLSEQDKKSTRDIGKLIGKSEKQVRAYLKVASAPADVQAKVKAGEVSIDSVGEGGCVVDHAPATKAGKCYVKQAGKRVTAHLSYTHGIDDPIVAKNHINDIQKALKQAQKSQGRLPRKKTTKSHAKADSNVTQTLSQQVRGNTLDIEGKAKSPENEEGGPVSQSLSGGDEGAMPADSSETRNGGPAELRKKA